MEHIKWFDLELLGEDCIDDEIKSMVISIFRYWRTEEIIIINQQKIKKWRPKRNVALLTNRLDLFELFRIIAAKTETKSDFSNFSTVFQTPSVLRLKIQ